MAHTSHKSNEEEEGGQKQNKTDGWGRGFNNKREGEKGPKGTKECM